MTSERSPKEAYVWVWLPGAIEPVVAGLLTTAGDQLVFNYGRSYLSRSDSIPLYEPELPLRSGVLPLEPGLSMPSCIRDAAPDAWGRRVIINHLLGHKAEDIDTAELDDLTYLLESGSDRIGALDFQGSATSYVPREAGTASLDELVNAAALVEKGVSLPRDLDRALFHGSSIGGARPKATIVADDKKFIAKFSAQNDVYSVVKAEFVAMRLAALAGIACAPVRLVQAGGKDVLLIERFDRQKTDSGWSRRIMVSALTILGLDEMMARYASYEAFAESIRHRFARPRETLRELFERLSFNVLCGNTDDHARNHAAFWDGSSLSLTPAYDICPQARTGREATQAMLIAGDTRMSQIAVCLDAAPNFLLSRTDAMAIIGRQIDAILEHWQTVCGEAQLSEVDQRLLWRRQFLNPFAFDGAPGELVSRVA